MFVGHFGVALVGKHLEPRLSLGTLTLGAMLPDILWPIFSLMGLEYRSGQTGSISDGFDAPFSHSLLTIPIWAIVLAAVYLFQRRYARGAVILILVVLSHGVLDSISGKTALAPGTNIFLGLGLWRSLAATLIVEGGFWLAAIILYARATHARNFAGTYLFWPVIAFLTLVWIANVRAGPPPPSAVVNSLVFFSVCVAWAYWMNQARPYVRREGRLKE